MPVLFSFRTPGKLQKFVADLHSGKLHREFHHGPEPEEQAAVRSPSSLSLLTNITD